VEEVAQVGFASAHKRIRANHAVAVVLRIRGDRPLHHTGKKKLASPCPIRTSPRTEQVSAPQQTALVLTGLLVFRVGAGEGPLGCRDGGPP